MENTTAPQRLDTGKLHRYLSEHLLGSASGLEHFRAARQTWAGTSHEGRLESLYQQITDDQRDLKKLIAALGYTPHPAVRLAMPLANLAGRFNPLNPLRRRRSSMAQSQLDMLTGLLNAKLAMWRTLLLACDADDRLDAALLKDLSRRAQSQIRQLAELSDSTWSDHFPAEQEAAAA